MFVLFLYMFAGVLISRMRFFYGTVTFVCAPGMETEISFESRIRVLVEYAILRVRRSTEDTLQAFGLTSEADLTTYVLDGAREKDGINVKPEQKEAVDQLDAAEATLLTLTDNRNLLQHAFYNKYELAPEASPGPWISQLHRRSELLGRVFPFRSTMYSSFVWLLKHACSETAANAAVKTLNPDAALPFPKWLAVTRAVRRLYEHGCFRVAANLADICKLNNAQSIFAAVDAGGDAGGDTGADTGSGAGSGASASHGGASASASGI